MASKTPPGWSTRKGGVGPSSWAGSIGKATQVWRNPKKPRSMAKKKGW